ANTVDLVRTASCPCAPTARAGWGQPPSSVRRAPARATLRVTVPPDRPTFRAHEPAARDRPRNRSMAGRPLQPAPPALAEWKANARLPAAPASAPGSVQLPRGTTRDKVSHNQC